MITKEEHFKALDTVRKIEFSARVDDLNALREVFGERVEETITDSRAERIIQYWQKVAAEHGRNDIQGMKDTLWKWVLDEGIEYDVEDTEEGR